MNLFFYLQPSKVDDSQGVQYTRYNFYDVPDFIQSIFIRLVSIWPSFEAATGRIVKYFSFHRYLITIRFINFNIPILYYFIKTCPHIGYFRLILLAILNLIKYKIITLQ